MMRRNIGIQKPRTDIGSGGIGKVVIPDPSTRLDYIRDSYRTHTITIYGGIGYGFFQAVQIPKDILQKVKWPTELDGYGSTLIWVKDAMSQLPVIVGILDEDKDFDDLQENRQINTYRSDNKTIEIDVNPNTAEVSINVVGDDITPAEVNVKLSSPNKDSVFSIESDNEVDLTAEKLVKITSYDTFQVIVKDKSETKGTLSYSKDKGLSYADEFGNTITTENGKITIKGNPLVEVNGGKNGGVLNIAQFHSFVQAVLKDLIIATSGSNVSNWMASEMPKDTDNNFTH